LWKQDAYEYLTEFDKKERQTWDNELLELIPVKSKILQAEM
jgi:hypothetical protein